VVSNLRRRLALRHTTRFLATTLSSQNCRQLTYLGTSCSIACTSSVSGLNFQTRARARRDDGGWEEGEGRNTATSHHLSAFSPVVSTLYACHCYVASGRASGEKTIEKGQYVFGELGESGRPFRPETRVRT